MMPFLAPAATQARARCSTLHSAAWIAFHLKEQLWRPEQYATYQSSKTILVP